MTYEDLEDQRIFYGRSDLIACPHCNGSGTVHGCGGSGRCNHCIGAGVVTPRLRPVS